jgi:exopolysaccharide biosynthesis polyprenyl glycosylphosphotransferase
MSTADISRRFESALPGESALTPSFPAIQPGTRSLATTLLVATDLVALSSGAFAMCFRFDGTSVVVEGPASMVKFAGSLLLFTVLLVLFCHTQGLYDGNRMRTAFAETAAVLKAATLALVVTLASGYLSVVVISRWALVGGASISLTALVSWRGFRRWRMSKRVAAGHDSRNILILGSGEAALELERHLQTNAHLGYVPRGFIAAGHEADGDVLGGVDDLEDIVHRHFIDEIFVILPADRELVMQLVIRSIAARVRVRILPDLYDGLTRPAAIEYVGPFPTIRAHEEAIGNWEAPLKRCVDILGSGSALVLSSPLLLATAIAIRVDSPGPVFYGAQRVGKKGRHFTCYKFRTMAENAEALKASLQKLNERDRVLFKISDDPRVTRLGRLLRKYSLDELPQFWNVLKGDMSLVGPRPATPGEVAQYESDHLKRLKAIPGITGLWQVEARCDPSFESYISLDKRYIDNCSLWLDLKILLKTIPVVLAGSGH